MTRLRGFLLCILCLVGCETVPFSDADAPPAPPALFEVAYRLDYGGRPTISINVNNEGPYDFIIDTAASQTSVFKNLTNSIGLDVDEQGSSRVFSLNGVQQQPSTRLSRIDLDGASAEDVRVVVFDDWTGDLEAPQGLIGLDLLADKVIEFDPRSQTFRIYAVSNRPDYTARGWSVDRLRTNTFGFASRPLYILPASFDFRTRRTPILIDTGSDLTLGNFPFLRTMVSTQTFIRLGAAPTRFTDVAGLREKSYRFDYSDLRSRGARWGEGGMYIARASIFDDLGYSELPFVIGGFDLFGKRPFAIDFTDRRIYVGRGN